MAANTKKAPTKSEIYAKIVDDTGLTRKDVAAVFESLNGQIQKNLGGRGAAGIFTVPGLLKMRVVKKPARKARKGTNPFTGEEVCSDPRKGTSVMIRRTLLISLSSLALVSACGGPGDSAAVPEAQPAGATSADIGNHVVHFTVHNRPINWPLR